MSATPEEAFARLRELARAGELAALCSEHGIDLLVVFGSVIDPSRSARAHDLDIAVLFDATAHRDLVRLVNTLVDRLHCDRIDVLDLGRAGPVAQEQALVGTVPLYERTAGRLASIRDAAIVRRMDTDWLRRLDIALMATS